MCPDPETFCKEKGVDFAEFSQLPDVKSELDLIEYRKKKAEAEAEAKAKAEAEAEAKEHDQDAHQLQLDEFRKQFPELTEEEIKHAMSLDQVQKQEAYFKDTIKAKQIIVPELIKTRQETLVIFARIVASESDFKMLKAAHLDAVGN